MHQIISSLKVPFVSQEPIPTIDRTYVADFLIMRKLIIEVDGPHHLRGRQPFKDERRDEAMKKMNFRVLRFTADEAENIPKTCAKRILAEIEKLPAEVKAEAYLPAGSYWKTRIRTW
jgi:very-short-patch-repair endonuclease